MDNPICNTEKQVPLLAKMNRFDSFLSGRASQEARTHPLLPPRGIFIPTHMIFNSHLPPAILLTWIQLRTLAWDGGVTPVLTLKEIARLTSRSQRILRQHIKRLNASKALVYQEVERGKMVITFPPETTIKSESKSAASPSTWLGSQAEVTDSASYFPPRILGYITYQDDREPI